MANRQYFMDDVLLEFAVASQPNLARAQRRRHDRPVPVRQGAVIVAGMAARKN